MTATSDTLAGTGRRSEMTNTNGSRGRGVAPARYIPRGAALLALSVAGAFLALWLCFVTVLCCVGIGVYLVPSAFGAVRKLANYQRRLALDWSGVEIAAPYQEEPEFRPGFVGALQRSYWMIGDPTTWREVLWSIVDPFVGGIVAFVPAALVLDGLVGLAMPFVWEQRLSIWNGSYYVFIPLNSEFMAILAAILGVVQLVIAAPLAPKLVKAHANITARWLRPTENSRLTSRVRQLTQARSTAVDTSAAELRRIERDLHDGAQARLVAMGMTLSAAENLLDGNPDAARALLGEAKASSKKALTELRDLVRGIHPPVLADRGLADAVRTLAMEAPLTVEVTAELAGRPQPPVESAAYFATSEVLNNVVKHAHARHAEIQIQHEDGQLRIQVTDDGIGGADPGRGTGLKGVENRLSTFDGFVSVVSPVGGPTLVSIVIPCVLTTQDPTQRRSIV
ncbi:MAG: putative two-component system sensor kinase [Amycolatopsis sp.]|jgi:signal transduction histidine kinase|nr:putative two-component system sensor kinase [Amycolatopsis sp.]